MNPVTDGVSAEGLVVVLAVVFLGFLPIIVSSARGRLVLEVAAILLTGIALLGIGALAVASFSGSGFAAALLMPLAGAFWFAGLLCGFVAYLDKAQERRNTELMFRLLHNDASRLPPPKGLKMPPLRNAEYEQFQR